MITDPRGVDLRIICHLARPRRWQPSSAASSPLHGDGHCDDRHLHQLSTIMPLNGDHVAYGDTGVVIYSNSVCGARSNFEGGPARRRADRERRATGCIWTNTAVPPAASPPRRGLVT